MGLIELLAPWIIAALAWWWWRRTRSRTRYGSDRQPEIHPSVMRHRTRPHERPLADESAQRLLITRRRMRRQGPPQKCSAAK